MNLAFTPLSFAIATAMGGLSALFAHRRGRNPYVWFFIGFLFGLIGIIAVFFIPPRKAVPQPEPKTEPVLKLAGPADKFWYYLDLSHAQQGPMSFDALARAFGQGKISTSTYVWHEDLPEWTPLQEFLQA